jgi:hypothetical protein
VPKKRDESCSDRITRRSGRDRAEVDDELKKLIDRVGDFERDGMDRGEAFERARDERLAEEADRAARDRRAAIMNKRKDIARTRFYDTAAQAIAKLSPKLAAKAMRLALEAKLVGVNVPFMRGRYSVDAQYVGLRRLWVGGLANDLEREGLLKIFARRDIEDKWTAELFELNKRPSAAYLRAKQAGEAGERDLWELTSRGEGPGNPGITKDAQALKIAQLLQKWQKTSMAALNREGAWIRSYSGYITRTSHSADKIAGAGAEKWVADTLPRLDLARTFGTADVERAREALFAMHSAMRLGDHFDYGAPVEEPLFPHTAKAASAERELHFKSGKDWVGYNAIYGEHNATHTIVQAFNTAARRAALMKEFGTRPREAYEADKKHLLNKLKTENDRLSAKIGALVTASESPAADAAAKAKIEGEIAGLRGTADAAAAHFDDFKAWLQALDNRFAQIDGTSLKPVNRARANGVAIWMSIQRMAKLGNIFATHFASLPTKAAEARYWGIPFAERYASLFRGLTSGAEGSERREALELTLVAAENRLGHIMNQYDVADAPAGFLSRWEATFFKLTGVSSVIDNQRGDFEAMAAAHLGGKRGQSWAEIGRKEQRVLAGYGIGEAEWKALSGVEWTTLDGKTRLYPSDAMKLSDDQVAAYLREAKPELAHAQLAPEDVARGREDLALQLVSAYSDRGGYAIPMPSARIRAILFGKSYEPGSPWNIAKKLFWQFKVWPADMITRAWGREMYGTMGDARLDRAAGIFEALAGAVVFGVAAEGIRDIIKGRDPLAKLREHPFAAIAAGAQRSGFGSIVGDYLLGQFDRHGLSAAANMLGPTFGQVDTLTDLLHAGGETKDGSFSPAAMRQRAADLMQLGRNNAPFMNLWLTHVATDALGWHALQEWIKPGYLQRHEQRERELEGTRYWLAPSKVNEALRGKRGATSPQSRAPLGWNLGNQ